MTDAAQTSVPGTGEGRGGLGGILAMLGIGIALIAALVLLGQMSRAVSLNRSAIGFDGLPAWLSENGVEARTFYGRGVLQADSVSLRILPLFDVDLDHPQDATNPEEAVMAETDRDIRRRILRRKIELLPTLVVMPKWRAGVREVAALHPDLLISAESAARVSGQLGREIGTLVRDADAPEAEGIAPSGARYLLHYPQTLRASPCEPVIGTREALLLGRCDGEGDPFWVLADPDLLNNHGLSQGENAAAALDWLPALGGEPVAGDEADAKRAIVVDSTTSIWWLDRSGRQQQRSWSDLARFFAYPFSVIWGSLAVLAALVFWRAWRRYGAADARSEEEKGPRAARMVAMDTKARLLRLAGRDDALVGTYVDARMDFLANEILGPQRQRGPGERDRLLAAVARRAPDLAEGLEPFRETRIAAAAPDTLLRHVAHLDDLIERTLDEFGRTGRAG